MIEEPQWEHLARVHLPPSLASTLEILRCEQRLLRLVSLRARINDRFIGTEARTYFESFWGLVDGLSADERRGFLLDPFFTAWLDRSEVLAAPGLASYVSLPALLSHLAAGSLLFPADTWRIDLAIGLQTDQVVAVPAHGALVYLARRQSAHTSLGEIRKQLDCGDFRPISQWRGRPLEGILFFLAASRCRRPDLSLARTEEDWSTRLDSARELLVCANLWSSFAGDLRAIVPLAATDPSTVSNHSAAGLEGILFTSLPPDDQLMAETIVHELAHMRLDSLLDRVDLIRPDRDLVRFASPWRSDPRPPRGLLQGLFAFCVVWQMYDSFLHSDFPLAFESLDLDRGETRGRAGRRLDQIRQAASQLVDAEVLTPIGEAVVAGIQDVLRSACGSPADGLPAGPGREVGVVLGRPPQAVARVLGVDANLILSLPDDEAVIRDWSLPNLSRLYVVDREKYSTAISCLETEAETDAVILLRAHAAYIERRFGDAADLYGLLHQRYPDSEDLARYIAFNRAKLDHSWPAELVSSGGGDDN